MRVVPSGGRGATPSLLGSPTGDTVFAPLRFALPPRLGLSASANSLRAVARSLRPVAGGRGVFSEGGERENGSLLAEKAPGG